MIIGAGRSRSPRETREQRASRRETERRDGAGEPLPPKLVPSLRAAFATFGSLIHTRLALAGVELEEEVQRFVLAAAFGIVAMIFVMLALVVGTFTIVFAVPPDYRIGTMIGLTVAYAIVAVFAVARLRSIFAHRPPIFAGTLAEIEKDRETLSQINRAHREGTAAREREARARAEPEQRPQVPEGVL
jgi:uncharacterized membrane protein YqjE